MVKSGVQASRPFRVYKIGREKATFWTCPHSGDHPGKRARELLCSPSIPKPCALQDPESHVSHFWLAEIIVVLIKAEILENKEENERDS